MREIKIPFSLAMMQKNGCPSCGDERVREEVQAVLALLTAYEEVAERAGAHVESVVRLGGRVMNEHEWNALVTALASLRAAQEVAP